MKANAIIIGPKDTPYENGILYFISIGIRAIDAKKNRKNNLTETSPYGPRIFALVHE